MIRFASRSDIPMIQKIEDLCFTDDRFNRRQINYLVTEAKSATFVEDDDGGICGYLILLFRSDSDSARVYSICVHPACQNKGIGSSLMRAAEELSRKHKCKRMTLEVSVQNLKAITFYQSLDFVVVRKLKDYYKSGVDGLRMQKLLM